MPDGRGETKRSGIVGQVTAGVVVAVVLGAGALVWNAMSNGQMVRLMGGITKEDGITKEELKTALSSVLSREEGITKEGLRTAISSVFSGVVAQRFGAKGPVGSVEGQDPADYTAANNGALVASRKEFPICAVTTIAIRAIPAGSVPGYCTLLSPQDLWRIYVSGYVSCIVTCFK
jgi:hypothetical protein